MPWRVILERLPVREGRFPLEGPLPAQEAIEHAIAEDLIG